MHHSVEMNPAIYEVMMWTSALKMRHSISLEQQKLETAAYLAEKAHDTEDDTLKQEYLIVRDMVLAS